MYGWPLSLNYKNRVYKKVRGRVIDRRDEEDRRIKIRLMRGIEESREG